MTTASTSLREALALTMRQRYDSPHCQSTYTLIGSLRSGPHRVVVFVQVVDDRRAATPNHGAVADFDRRLIVDVTYATLDLAV
ncbi:MAG: hypothetical protein WA622_22755 [Mycobacterium sp.]|uniref:hypothetical protein n=1 Tax=Mycobacterium sp. TaxID=1785 RepID=UPI003BB6CAD0